MEKVKSIQHQILKKYLPGDRNEIWKAKDLDL
jgi:hypothetical protein